jgi:hypothetical protein
MGLNLSNQQIAQELDLDKDDVYQMTSQLRTGVVQVNQKSSCLEKWSVMRYMSLPDIKVTPKL